MIAFLQRCIANGSGGLAMDLFDLLQEWDLRNLRERLDRLQSSQAGLTGRELKEMAQESIELKLRLGLLIRLLIAKGVISAQEYADAIARARETPPAGQV
jgi:hypothetical protein